MRERIVIVFIAIAIGLIVTTLVFFLYQQTKTIPKNPSNIISGNVPTPTPADSVYLVIDEPSDESISDRRSIQVKGRTGPGNTVVVSTNQEDVVASPTTDGKFSISITIDSGTNKIVTRSISSDGSDAVDTRVITFSTEEF
jgi:hypothetical protein